MRIWIKAGGLLVLYFYPFFPVLGQVSQPARFEREYKYSDGSYSVMSMKDEGLFLIRDKEKFESGKKIWEVVMLDTDLKEVKNIDLKVESRNRLLGYEYVPGKMYLLFRQGDTERSDLELIEISRSGDEDPRFSLKPELPLSITHFTIVGSSAVLGGYVNKEPSILLFNLKTEALKVLPGFLQTDTELVDLRTNVNSTFNVVLVERAQRDERRMVFQTYDQFGQRLLEDVVSIRNKITLQTGLTSNLEREDLVVAGTWGEGNSKQSNGFYLLPVSPFTDQKIQLVAFGELEHFLDYQKEGRATRIAEKTKEEMQNNGIPNFVTYIMPFRLDEYENGFLMLAELYTPSSSFSNFTSPYSPNFYNPYYSPYGWYYPGYGRMYNRPYSYNQSSRRVDEVKTFQSVVVAFDPSGKVLWDHSLELDDIKQASLDQVADFYYQKDELVFLFRDESSELKIKRISRSEEETELVVEKIKANNPDDEIRSERDLEGGLRFWYGNSFYVWGYQSIKNPTMKDRLRDVFYINKIQVE